MERSGARRSQGLREGLRETETVGRRLKQTHLENSEDSQRSTFQESGKETLRRMKQTGTEALQTVKSATPALKEAHGGGWGGGEGRAQHWEKIHREVLMKQTSTEPLHPSDCLTWSSPGLGPAQRHHVFRERAG